MKKYYVLQEETKDKYLHLATFSDSTLCAEGRRELPKLAVDLRLIIVQDAQVLEEPQHG